MYLTTPPTRGGCSRRPPLSHACCLPHPRHSPTCQSPHSHAPPPVCWGSFHLPHTPGLPLSHVVMPPLDAPPRALSNGTTGTFSILAVGVLQPFLCLSDPPQNGSKAPPRIAVVPCCHATIGCTFLSPFQRYHRHILNPCHWRATALSLFVGIRQVLMSN
jgi:hypothetical protein